MPPFEVLDEALEHPLGPSVCLALAVGRRDGGVVAGHETVEHGPDRAFVVRAHVLVGHVDGGDAVEAEEAVPAKLPQRDPGTAPLDAREPVGRVPAAPRAWLAALAPDPGLLCDPQRDRLAIQVPAQHPDVYDAFPDEVLDERRLEVEGDLHAP